MRIPLDRESGQPLYLQIASFIRKRIEDGALPAGTRLPAIRPLSCELGVNRITIENAYAALEAAGLLAARVGSGTFVLPPFPGGPSPVVFSQAVAWPAWQQHVIERHKNVPVKPAIPLLSHDTDVSVIALNSGNTDPRLFPVEELRFSLRDTMRREGMQASEYEAVAGYPPLRRTISHLLADQGIPAAQDDIVITAGSQQALALATSLLTVPGDTIFVESPTYADGLDLFRSRGLKIIPLAMDAEGMRMDVLEQLLCDHAPRYIYTIPNFQNPTGICMSGQRRRQLVQLAEAAGVPLIEDDFVGELRYEGYTQPSLKALAKPGACLYVGTFSKMLMPGLRVGYLVAEGPVRDLLIRCKRLQDLSSSGIIQRALYRFVSVGRHRTHLARTSHIYRKRRDALLRSIADHLPQGVQVQAIAGGLFAWCSLPDWMKASTLVPHAMQHGVAVAPGTAFFLHPDEGEQYIRMNFTLHEPEILEEAMRRLGRAMRSMV